MRSAKELLVAYLSTLHWDRHLHGPNDNDVRLSDFQALAIATLKGNRPLLAVVEGRVFQTHRSPALLRFHFRWPSRHGTELPGAKMLHGRHAATGLYQQHPTRDV